MLPLTKLRLAPLLALALAPEISNAFLSVDEVFRAKESSSREVAFMADMYVGGMMEALWNANGHLSDTGGTPLFCLPATQNLQTEELTQLGFLALTKAKNSPAVRKMQGRSATKLPASILLLFQLQDMYPCPK